MILQKNDLGGGQLHVRLVKRLLYVITVDSRHIEPRRLINHIKQQVKTVLSLRKKKIVSRVSSYVVNDIQVFAFKTKRRTRLNGFYIRVCASNEHCVVVAVTDRVG